MIWKLLIGFLILSGIGFFLGGKKGRLLKEEKKIIDRNLIFFKREHIFETSTEHLSQIGEAIDKEVLYSENISYEPHYEHQIIVFHNKALFVGAFSASLRMIKNNENHFLYSFKIDTWAADTGLDYLRANILLTAIEKAFLKLDPNTKVSDHARNLTYKYSTRM